jgi:hypothetical protein
VWLLKDLEEAVALVGLEKVTLVVGDGAASVKKALKCAPRRPQRYSAATPARQRALRAGASRL